MKFIYILAILPFLVAALPTPGNGDHPAVAARQLTVDELKRRAGEADAYNKGHDHNDRPHPSHYPRATPVEHDSYHKGPQHNDPHHDDPHHNDPHHNGPHHNKPYHPSHYPRATPIDYNSYHGGPYHNDPYHNEPHHDDPYHSKHPPHHPSGYRPNHPRATPEA